MDKLSYSFSSYDLIVSNGILKIEKKKSHSLKEIIFSYLYFQKFGIITFLILIVCLLYFNFWEPCIALFLILIWNIKNVSRISYCDISIPVKSIKRISSDSCNMIIAYNNDSYFTRRHVIIITKQDEQVCDRLMQYLKEQNISNKLLPKEKIMREVLVVLGVISIIVFIITFFYFY